MPWQLDIVSLEFTWNFWAWGRQDVAGWLTVHSFGPFHITTLAPAT